jgi:hypothetical protein
MINEQRQIMPDFCSRQFPFHYVTALNTLKKMGVDIDNIDILAAGEFENYKGEVREQSPDAGTILTDETRIMLKVGFPSAVDYMPYQFFYGLGGGVERSSEWEDKSRELMAPFDAAIVRNNARARYEILKFSHSFLEYEHLIAFLKLFAFDLNFDSRQISEILSWMALLPAFHHWGGNPKYVEAALELIFGYDFQIIENIEAEFSIPEPIQYRLGARIGRLGHEAIIGRKFSESDSTYIIKIHGIHINEVKGFLPGGGIRRKIEKVLQICMPNNLEYKIKCYTIEKKAIIGNEKKRGFLGYATYI